MANCLSCEKELTPQFLGKENEDYQFDNALWLGFFGGYGMFVESPEYVTKFETKAKTSDAATYEAVICHDCASELCDTNPWLKKLLKPETAHSHRAEYWEANPDHEGWDKKADASETD